MCWSILFDPGAIRACLCLSINAVLPFELAQTYSRCCCFHGCAAFARFYLPNNGVDAYTSQFGWYGQIKIGLNVWIEKLLHCGRLHLISIAYTLCHTNITRFRLLKGDFCYSTFLLSCLNSVRLSVNFWNRWIPFRWFQRQIRLNERFFFPKHWKKTRYFLFTTISI